MMDNLYENNQENQAEASTEMTGATENGNTLPEMEGSISPVMTGQATGMEGSVSQAAQTEQPQNYYAYPNPGYYPYYGQMPYQQMPPVPPVPQKKKSGAFKKFMAAVALAVVFGLVAGGTFIGANELYNYLKPSENDGDDANNNYLPVKEEDRIEATTVVQSTYIEGTKVSDIVESAAPSTVAVNSTFTNNSSWFGAYESSGSGSGIIVGENKSELLIITNNHVVDNANSVKVVLIDETEVAAEIKGTDSNADLALLAVKKSDLTEETLAAIKIAKLGSSDDVRVGEMVVAIGNALGYGQSVTVGYVSAKDRIVNVDGLEMTLLQTDAAINPGNSGGALLNLDGEVIGINSVKYASASVEGMGFAIPVSNVTDIIESLMNILEEGEKGYLGVRINNVTEVEVAYYGWPEGIYVVEFTENSGAKEAGIQIGDIITKINGINVRTTSDLISRVTANPYGTTVTLTVQRLVDGAFTEMEIEVTLRQSTSYLESEEEGEQPATSPTPVPEDNSQRRRLPR